MTMTALSDRLAAAATAAFGAHVSVVGLERLSGGACQDNYCVDLHLAPGAHDGTIALAGDRRFVLRSDAVRSLPGSVARRVESGVITAARLHDVPTPAVRLAAEDIVRPGASAILLDWCEGTAIGRRVVASPSLAHARSQLPAALADALARIHRVRPEHAPTLLAGSAFVLDPTAAALDALDCQLDAMVEPHPALHWIAHALRDSAPEGDEVVLVHGDFRVGNFMVSETGLQGILDWEFAHWGSAAEDLAWIAVRDWRFGALSHAIGGLCDREPFYLAYERVAGRRINRDAVHWWEVMGNARWAAGAVHQAERVLSGAENDLEFVAIGRRAAEMEWEALRLLERGPSRCAQADAPTTVRPSANKG